MRKILLWLCAAIFLFMFSGTTAAALDYKFNMSYIYFGNSSAYTSLVDDTQDSLDEVAPNYFTLDDSGNLTLTNAVSQDFISEMHVRDIRVVPYLTNNWDRQVGISALSNRDALSSSLAGAVAAYGLDGVNIDLENLNENQRADYVDFVRLLREKLPAGKTVAVAVAVNPGGAATGWAASYDYAALSRYCDYLLLMAYDESYYGSAPGPVSSMRFIENSIEYALGQVPKEKIVLGLPFYGRIWSQSGGYPQGYGISNTRITQLLDDYKSAVYTDSASRSACAIIKVQQSDPKPVVGGRTLAAGTYTIWYENAQTLKEKLDLVQKYDLMGAGSWSLGQEDDATWSYYKLRLNGCTFDDIEDSWARDYILDAYLNGWVSGTSKDSFDPGLPLTRAEAAAMLVRFLGYPAETGADVSFDDVNSGWAKPYVETARRYGIISGVGGNLFAPDCPVTRQELAVMLQRILGASADSAPCFPDVTTEANPWSCDAIAALSAAGVFTGFPDGSFRPYNDVSRAEMAALLTRIKTS